MSRARLALAAAALAAATGCTSSSTSTAGAQLTQPSAIALFEGRTLQDPANLVPYLAIANAGRNDLTLVDVRTDTIVEAPVRLRPLAIPFPDRPTLLVSSDLGDGGPDLLVGVSAGDSELQLVRTWAADNGIEGTASVDLAGEDILALAPLPGQPAGEARLVAALAGGRLAVVHYRRATSSDAIEKDTSVAPGAFTVQDVGFQAIALATVPGDGTHVYAATLDPIGPGAIQGVAEIDLGATPWTVRALDARGPTRLVAAARLLERKRSALERSEAAFAGQTEVTRVYAVLDERGCGPRRRIACGLVALDPSKVPGAGDDHIPEDDWSQAAGASWMPYRAPVQFVGRPLALAVASPPASLPPDTTYSPGFMRLRLDAGSSYITTSAAVVALDDGSLQFVDLGRFKVASTTSVPASASASATLPPFVETPDEATPDKRSRLWLRDAAGTGFAQDAEEGAKTIGITPGYSPGATWTVTYQGIFPDLQGRSAEAGWDGANVWLAIQLGEGPLGAHVTSQVARLYHPALGIAAGDIVVIRNRDAVGNPICTLTLPDTTTEQVDMDFELDVAADGMLPPTSDRPGGAVKLEEPTLAGEKRNCYLALQALAQAAAAPPPTTPPTPPTLVPRLLATIRSGGLLLLRDAEYAGRPPLDADYPLEYRLDPDADTIPDSPDEDALAMACPLADWDGIFREAAPPPVCDSAACRADCEKLVLARLARRVYHLSENCDTAPGTPDQACTDSYGPVLPFLNGPAVKFRAAVEVENGNGAPTLHRSHVLTLRTESGVSPLADFPGGTTAQTNGAVAFDPSTAAQPSEAYRFYVSYPGNQVVAVTPTTSPITRTSIR